MTHDALAQHLGALEALFRADPVLRSLERACLPDWLCELEDAALEARRVTTPAAQQEWLRFVAALALGAADTLHPAPTARKPGA